MTENIKSIIEGLSDNQVLLPVGLKDRDGVIHRVATLRPMTGDTEEAISDPKVRDNGGKMITELLADVVESIGTITKVSKEVIRDLTTIDRDFLLLQNRKYSIGDEVKYIDNCPHCKAKNEIIHNIASIEANYMESEEQREITFDLPNGYFDGKVLHKTITVTLPTGRIQERIAPLIRVNPAQATTTMLHMITIKLGTLDFINPDVFKKMTKKDRDFISVKLAEQDFGISFSSEVPCSDCGMQFVTSIQLASLLGE